MEPCQQCHRVLESNGSLLWPNFHQQKFHNFFFQKLCCFVYFFLVNIQQTVLFNLTYFTTLLLNFGSFWAKLKNVCSFLMITLKLRQDGHWPLWIWICELKILQFSFTILVKKKGSLIDLSFWYDKLWLKIGCFM